MFSYVLFPVLFIVAFVYAGVGLGGGTAYLAFLSFWSTNPDIIRPIAWTLNVLSAGLGFYNYSKAGHFDHKLAWYFIGSGVIGGSVGAMLNIPWNTFKLLLGICLFCVSFSMILEKRNSNFSGNTYTRPSTWIQLAVGFIIGIISGIIGIGGGVLLGPVMHAFKWAETKKISAITSAYVCFCSLGSVITYFISGGRIELKSLALSGSVVVLGAYLGSWYCAFKASPALIKRVFGAIVMVAALRILYTMFW